MEGRGLPSGRSDYFQTDDWDTVAFKWAAGVKRIPYDFNKRDTYIYYLSACAYPQGTVCSRRTGCILKPDLRYLRIPGKGEDAGGKLLLYRWAGQESRVSRPMTAFSPSAAVRNVPNTARRKIMHIFRMRWRGGSAQSDPGYGWICWCMWI